MKFSTAVYALTVASFAVFYDGTSAAPVPTTPDKSGEQKVDQAPNAPKKHSKSYLAQQVAANGTLTFGWGDNWMAVGEEKNGPFTASRTLVFEYKDDGIPDKTVLNVARNLGPQFEKAVKDPENAKEITKEPSSEHVETTQNENEADKENQDPK